MDPMTELPLKREETILKEGEQLYFEQVGEDPTRWRSVFIDSDDKRVEHYVRILRPLRVERRS